MSRVFITGAGGMVGKNLLNVLVENDMEVYAPNREELNLFDNHSVEVAFKNFKPDLVIHLAGVVGGIRDNIDRPVDYLVENVEIGNNVIKSAFRADVKRFLNLGSSCIYPRDAHNPLEEESLLTGNLEPTNEGYALAKIYALKLCSYYSRQYGVEYKTIIPPNLYGPYDKFGKQRSHLIPAIIQKIDDAVSLGHSKINIWGDGLVRREFMYVMDLVSFIIRILDEVEFDKLPEVMNLGLGYDYTINEYYEEVMKAMKFDLNFEHDLTKPVGMKQKLLNISKAKHIFNWEPQYSLQEGLMLTLEHFYSNKSNLRI
ncbi:NAD-dependent epimerase/dehydratase family protein [uncultured Roseivirga sp.]|uniref:NAD-dependent epimerase/dehydratase family protein n=1 Tax=uncultured Roseivirga sp. TaxID=543088 RepID=UPI000D797389|nr:NAD-dependent epimerase/dehydratase family protein [uncultured Roseivirga sp.]PWL30935.1 MAG: GDP-fucose synthetase [Roseivirga sp. XM-24bin3]